MAGSECIRRDNVPAIPRTRRCVMDWPIGRPRKYTIGREGNPYLTRWDLLGNRHTNWPHVYIHQFHRSDSDAALHSHPWLFFSAILKGGYYEATPTGTKWIKPWSI